MSEERKHTPGPWRAVNVGYATSYQAHILIEPGVAALWAPPEISEQGANALLIAAAPELLEALREAVSTATHAPSCAAMISDGADCNCGIFTRCVAWEAVIAKAEGR